VTRVFVPAMVDNRLEDDLDSSHGGDSLPARKPLFISSRIKKFWWKAANILVAFAAQERKRRTGRAAHSFAYTVHTSCSFQLQLRAYHKQVNL